LNGTLHLAFTRCPPRGEGRQPASPVAGKKNPHPSQAQYECSGKSGSICQGYPRCARRFAALTAPVFPLLETLPPGRKTGSGWGREKGLAAPLHCAALVGRGIAVCGLLHRPKRSRLVWNKLVGISAGGCPIVHRLFEGFASGKRRDGLGGTLDRGACAGVACGTRLTVPGTETPQTT